MLDLTKDELQEIKCALENDLDKFGKPYHRDTLEKVNDFIDSYCDHKKLAYCHNCNTNICENHDCNYRKKWGKNDNQ